MAEQGGTSNGCDPSGRTASPEEHTCAIWPKLCVSQWVPLIVALTVLAVVTIPRLPTGICYSDGGDLQLASTTLGVMHPPGYCGYVTLGYVLTRIPGVDPAYLVSLACLASGILALWLCMMMQVRLGVSPWIASATALALWGTQRVWENLIAPEVYMPTLAFLAGAAYQVLKYARLGRRRDLLLGAALFGMALANRPTTVWTLPFLLLAWWMARKHWEPVRRDYVRSLCYATVMAALPGVYSLGYLWIRDSATIPYNYVEHHNAEFHSLPEATEGARAKAQRIAWLVSGHEFRRYLSRSWRDARLRLYWLYREFGGLRYVEAHNIPLLLGPVPFLIGLSILVFGGALVFSRCRTSFWLLTGMVIGNILFICSYRIYGHAADLLPLLFTAGVFGGVALSVLFPLRSSRRRTIIAAVVLVMVSGFTVLDASRRRLRADVDATPFLAAVDMPTLPRDSVICSTWRESPPLWYAKHELTGRYDIDVINTVTSRWLERLVAFSGRPVFSVRKSSALTGHVVTPFRVFERDGKTEVLLWRIEREPVSRPQTLDFSDHEE